MDEEYYPSNYQTPNFNLREQSFEEPKPKKILLIVVFFIVVLLLGGGIVLWKGSDFKSKKNIISEKDEKFSQETTFIDECAGLNDEFDKSLCYTDLAVANQDPIICNKLSDKFGVKDNCLISVAIDKKEISICDKITIQYSKDYCYSKIGAAKQDLSICSSIRKEFEKDFCYSDIAIAKQDLKICEYVVDSLNKDSCIEKIKG